MGAARISRATGQEAIEGKAAYGLRDAPIPLVAVAGFPVECLRNRLKPGKCYAAGPIGEPRDDKGHLACVSSLDGKQNLVEPSEALQVHLLAGHLKSRRLHSTGGDRQLPRRPLNPTKAPARTARIPAPESFREVENGCDGEFSTSD